MAKKISLRLLSLLLLLALLLCAAGCGGGETGEAVKLSFKSASTYEYLKSIDGKTVTLNGYMATASPVDGSFMFLMNLPYQSCPFCVPNTKELSNTMEVYPKKGEKFTYTTQAIKIVGRLVVAESEDRPFTDEYGYKFCCKIVDASYTVIRSEELSANMALWQKIAESDVITDIYAMYDYVNFLCAWDTYYVNNYTDKNGNLQKGFYLYPGDALYYITTNGEQWNYGYKEGYFDSIVAAIERVDKTAFTDLVENVRRAEALAARALSDLQNGNYTASDAPVYVEKFDTYQYIYKPNESEAFIAEMQNIYTAFSDWLGSWEL